MTVTANAASVNSGQKALYNITVTPQTGTADDVTVQISAFVRSGTPPTPVFTVCGKGDGTQTCTVGTIHSGQSSQMQGQIAIPSSAGNGDTFTLAAKVTGAAPGATATGSVTGSASTSAVAPTTPPPSSSSPPTSGHHHSGSGSTHHSGSGSHNGSGSGNGTGGNGSTGTTGNTNPLAGLPPLSTSGGTSPLGVSTSNPGGLFPTISPSPAPTAPPGTTSTGSKSKAPYKATTVADVLPLNHGLLNVQVAGLIVLGLGIALVFARISLRKPKSTENKP